MRKLMLFLAVTIVVIACGTPSNESVSTDSTVVKTDSIVSIDTTTVDTTTVDTTKLVK